MTDQNEQCMREAIRLSEEGMRENRGGPFGAVVVKDGKVIGRGQNRVTSTNDPTAHAEVVAIRDACQTIKDFSLKGAVLYSSCEPCPMCLAACYWARLDKIYYGNERSDAAKINFDDEWLYHEVKIPIKERALPMEQLLHKEALVVFNEWQAKSDKTRY
jgi:guanine deaminase